MTNNKRIIIEAKKIPNHGVVSQSDNGYLYLKIHDDYIYNLFPLLSPYEARMPNYFLNKENIGAHISIIYSDEHKKFDYTNIIGTTIDFNIVSACKAKFNSKVFFVLTVISMGLKNLRLQYGLSKKPVYHGVKVNFHITIGMLHHA